MGGFIDYLLISLKTKARYEIRELNSFEVTLLVAWLLIAFLLVFTKMSRSLELWERKSTANIRELAETSKSGLQKVNPEKAKDYKEKNGRYRKRSK